MGHPSVSCIIPTRDSAASLRGAIESVLCQSVCPAEIIVADAGSTDTSRDVAREFGSWVRLVWCARSTHADADVAAARRLGLRFATCDFITMLDPVARWRPDKLERQLAHLAARPGLDLSITEIGPETRLNGEQSALEHAYTTLLARRVAFGVSGDPEFMLALSRGDGWISCAEDRGLRYELLPEILAHIPGHTLAHVVEDGPRTADEPTASPARGQPRDGRLRWGADAFAGGSRGP